MEPDEAALFEHGLRRAAEASTGSDLDRSLDALGWSEALADDPRVAVGRLFTVQGETGVTSSALGRLLLQVLDPDGRGPVGDGAAVVLPAAGEDMPPGRVEDVRLRVDGVATTGLADRPEALVVATDGSGSVARYTVPTASLRIHPVAGADPTLGLVRVTGDLDPSGPGTGLAGGVWEAVVGRGRVALAHELTGASRTMLELACDHARDRSQFGRPIASFQAVRHRLADARVELAAAEAVLDAAWLDPAADTAATAKAVAGHGARAVARHGQQVLAGIGFTVEHPFHRFLARVLVLDAILGSASSLTTAFGTELIERRAVPPLLPL